MKSLHLPGGAHELSRVWLFGATEPLDQLPRDLRDQLKVLVQGQYCAAGYFGKGRDEKVRDRWCMVLAAIGQPYSHHDGLARRRWRSSLNRRRVEAVGIP